MNGPAVRPPVCAWFTPSRFVLLLGMLIAVSFHDILFLGRSFMLRDFGYQSYPWAFHFRESMLGGEVPLWNPLNNCGHPFLAEWNTLTLYPGSLFYVLLPLPWSLCVFNLLHMLLGGAGAYFLARRWTGHAFGGAVAGTIFAFNGLTLGSLIWPHYCVALGWMPWMLLAVGRACRDGGRWLVWGGLAGAMQMFSGVPEIIALTWVFAGVLQLRALIRHRDQWRARSLRLALQVALVVGLCAVQLLPFLDLLDHSNRGSGFSASSWAVPLSGLANYLVPLFHTFPMVFGVHFQYTQLLVPSYYPGVGCLLLAWSALKQREAKRRWFLGGVTLAAVVLSLGDPGLVFKWLRSAFPFLGFFRYPVKILYLALPAGVLLAALGAARFDVAGRRRWELTGGAIMIVLMGVIAWVAWHHPRHLDVPSLTVWNAASRAVFVVAVLGLMVLMGKPLSGNGPLAVRLGFLFVLWLDVQTHAPWQNPTVPAATMVPKLMALEPQPQHGVSRAMVSAFANKEMYSHPLSEPDKHYLLMRAGMSSNTSLLEDIPVVDGFYSLYVGHMRRVMLMLYTDPHTHLPHLMDFMAVSQTTAPGQVFDWMARTNPLPYVTGGQTPVTAPDDAVAAALQSADFDPARVVYLPPEGAGAVASTNASDVKILSSKFSAHRVEIEAEAAGPGLVVISQAYYPWWMATVDGAPAPVLRANLAFQAVPVGVGKHRIVLSYEDRGFRIGCAVSLLTLLACGGGVAVQRRRMRGSKA